MFMFIGIGIGTVIVIVIVIGIGMGIVDLVISFFYLAIYHISSLSFLFSFHKYIKQQKNKYN